VRPRARWWRVLVGRTCRCGGDTLVRVILWILAIDSEETTMPYDVPPYDVPPDDDAAPPRHASPEDYGACLVAALTAGVASWRRGHPEATLDVVADALLFGAALTRLHLWQAGERQVPEPPCAWADFRAAMTTRLADALQEAAARCACPACRGPEARC